MNKIDNMHMPLDVGIVHFVGIGGIGMSGIAELLNHLGYSITGSDMSNNANVKRLKSLGVKVIIGHDASNVNGAGVVVVSTAIEKNNEEYKSAKLQKIPVVKRAEMLVELIKMKTAVAVAGAHGKTTTTSLVSHAMSFCGFDPTVINGGIINSLNTNAVLGQGDWLVAEADESDGTFIKIPSTVAVVTNIDSEHLDYYGTFDSVKDAFKTFVENIPFYGFAVLCTDDENVQQLSANITDRKIIKYGLNKQADVRAKNLRVAKNGGTIFDIYLGEKMIKDFYLPMSGKHNVLNSVAAVAVVNELGVDVNNYKEMFKSFKGVKRRFTRVGKVNGALIIDDYAHHPKEIKSVLQAAREVSSKKVIAVMQPHRYTRLESLFDDFCACFNDADKVITLPVYSANEQEIEGVNHKALAEGILSMGHKNAIHCDDILKNKDEIINEISSGDVVVFLGAGSITLIASDFVESFK